MSLQQQRVETIQQIIFKAPYDYGYLSVQPFLSQISNNYQTFPNEFLHFLLQKINEFDNYHRDVATSDPTYGLLFQNFIAQYQNCSQILYQYQQIQYYQSNFNQPSFNQPSFNQPTFNQPTFNQPFYSQPNFNQPMKNNYYGQNQQQIYINRQHYNHKHHRHEKDSYFEDDRRFHKKSHKKSKKHKSSSRSKQKKKLKKLLKHQNRQKYNQSYQNQSETKLYYQQHQNYHHQHQFHKPPPKPAKFSLKQIRQFVHQWSIIRDKPQVSKDLIQQVNQMNSYQKGETTFQQMSGQEDIFGNKKIKELTQEEKLQINKKNIQQLLEPFPKQNFQEGYQKTVLILQTNPTLFDLMAVGLVKTGCSNPEYASKYAMLAKKISQLYEKKIKKQNQGQKPYKNGFREKITLETESIFKKQLNEKAKLKSEDQKDKYVEESRERLMRIMNWIGSLIRKNAMKRKIARVCIEMLVFQCLKKFYNYRKRPTVHDSNYHVYFDALICFLTTLGSSFEKLQNPSENLGFEKFDSLYDKITSLIVMKIKPECVSFEQFDTINTYDILTIMELIDLKVIRNNFPQISLKLAQLIKLRKQKWEKIEGQNKKTESYGQYQKRLKTMVKECLNQASSLEKVYEMFELYSEFEMIYELMSQIEGSSKEEVEKRIKFFKKVLLTKFRYNNVKAAWFRVLENLADDYDLAQLNVQILNRILVEIAVAYHEPKEYLRPKNGDERVNSLYDRILASRTKK